MKMKMKRARESFPTPRWFWSGLFIIAFTSPTLAATAERSADSFPRPIDSYADDALAVGAKLLNRIQQEPFNAVTTALFLAAIIHTFLAPRFMAIAHRYQHALEEFDGDESHPEHGP